jgi:hypothetical protein
VTFCFRVSLSIPYEQKNQCVDELTISTNLTNGNNNDDLIDNKLYKIYEELKKTTMS